MSKLQLIAKAVITTIGVSTAAGYIRYLYLFPRSAADVHIWSLAIWKILLLLAFAATIYWLVFRNNWLVTIASGTQAKDAPISPVEQKRTLAIWLRLLLVFSGLRILTNSSRAFRLLLYLNPVKIRAWIQGLTGGDYPQFSDFLSRTALTNIGNLLTLALAVYLLLGASHLVRWHVRRLAVTNNNIDLSGGNNDE